MIATTRRTNGNTKKAQPKTTVSGFVEKANETGVCINGQWYNVSKYTPVELPDVGEMVDLTITGNNWIKDWTAPGDPFEDDNQAGYHPMPRRDGPQAQESDAPATRAGLALVAPSQAPAPSYQTDKDKSIIRQCCIKAAAATQPQSVDDLLEIAERLEEWVTR